MYKTGLSIHALYRKFKNGTLSILSTYLAGSVSMINKVGTLWGRLGIALSLF